MPGSSHYQTRNSVPETRRNRQQSAFRYKLVTESHGKSSVALGADTLYAELLRERRATRIHGRCVLLFIRTVAKAAFAE